MIEFTTDAGKAQYALVKTKRMQGWTKLSLAIVCAFILMPTQSQAAPRCEGAYRSGDLTRTALPHFMVSVLLQRDDAREVVKLVHSDVAAANAAGAEVALRNGVRAQYPDYTVIDILSTALAAGDECVSPANAGSPFMRTTFH